MEIKNIERLISSLNYAKELDLKKLKYNILSSDEIFIFGNGGSNSISQHIEIDFRKFLNKKTTSISSSSLLSAYANDYSFENSFVNYLKESLSKDNSLVILISSSGESKNIIKCAEFCSDNGINFITLTGFSIKNKLHAFESKNKIMSIHIPYYSYGTVEICHEAILHSIIEN